MSVTGTSWPAPLLTSGPQGLGGDGGGGGGGALRYRVEVMLCGRIGVVYAYLDFLEKVSNFMGLKIRGVGVKLRAGQTTLKSRNGSLAVGTYLHLERQCPPPPPRPVLTSICSAHIHSSPGVCGPPRSEVKWGSRIPTYLKLSEKYIDIKVKRIGVA